MRSGCFGLAVVALAAALPASAQVMRVAEMNTEQVKALDRARTAVLIPGGILEQHGPYLPAFTDGYYNEYAVRAMAEAVAARPGWTALVFPTIPLGTGGANEIGGHFVFPGTYAVRSTTLRAVFMDLADEVGQQGFRWVFLVHGHGAPNHNRAVEQAAAYFRDTYGGQMVHVTDVMDQSRRFSAPAEVLGAEAAREDGFSVHAGAAEHSSLMFLRPDLVPSTIRQAPAVTAADFSGLVAEARRPGWTGYFGAPRHANAAAGARWVREGVEAGVALMNKVLDGWDPSQAPRLVDMFLRDPAVARVAEAALAREREAEARQRAWLAKAESARKPGSVSP
jgi:creatinine amidohydrolase/Fe(II)-dependent formamide hydrolase-like protein